MRPKATSLDNSHEDDGRYRSGLLFQKRPLSGQKLVPESEDYYASVKIQRPTVYLC